MHTTYHIITITVTPSSTAVATAAAAAAAVDTSGAIILYVT
jgi:hypothetical protein